MSKLSLSMIVKNEEKFLKDCLESVVGVVDEIIVVDTGSTDATVKIAREYDAQIHNFKWINDFSAARNFSLSKCTGDWILYLDADERLNKESVQELKKVISTNKKLSVYCNIYNVDEINNKPNMMKYTRLFKNSPGIKFKGRAHEQIEKSLEEKGYQLINSNITITHIGYNLERDGLKQKAKRNLQLLLEDYKSTKSSYSAFQLGNTYNILVDKQKAFEYYSIAMKDPKLSDSYFGISAAYVAEYNMNIKNNQEALEILEKGLGKSPDHPLLNYVGSEIVFRLGNGQLAVELCRKAYVENEKFAKMKTASSALDVVLNKEEVLYHGLNIAVQKNINEGIKYFLDELGANFSREDYTFNDEVNLIVALAQNDILDTMQYSTFKIILTKNNLDFYLNLISNYTHDEMKIELLKAASEKLNKNVTIRNKLGLAYSKSGKTDEAIKVFEETLDEFKNDPTPVFYLVSLYIERKDFTRLKSILIDSKKRFMNNKAFQKQFTELEKKLAGVIPKD